MSRFRPGLLPTLLVLALLPLLVWLGFWQLERSEQKRELLERQQARQEAAPLTPEQLDGSAGQAYARVYLQGRFDAAHSFLLDSRTRDGQVGVELLQPFYDEPSGRWLLINRGWLPWPDRRIAPQFDTPQQPLKLAAWLYVPPGKPFVFSERMAEGWPWGTADEVAKRIIAQADAAGANMVQVSLNRGAMPHEMFIEQIPRFAREVLPVLQAHRVERVPAVEEMAA